uniref:ING domain-containing protein n=1 Tax=Strongyloides papillosus TaxID=174720 RepID=A0A0N5CC83_STREA
MDPRRRTFNPNEQSRNYNNTLPQQDQINYPNNLNNINGQLNYFDKDLNTFVPNDLVTSLLNSNNGISAYNELAQKFIKECENIGVHHYDVERQQVISEIEDLKKKKEEIIKEISQLGVYAQWDNDDSCSLSSQAEEYSDDDDEGDDNDDVENRDRKFDESLSRKFSTEEEKSEEPVTKKSKPEKSSSTSQDNENSVSKITANNNVKNKDTKFDESLSQKFNTEKDKREKLVTKKSKSEKSSKASQDRDNSVNKITEKEPHYEIIIDEEVQRCQEDEDTSPNLNDILFDKEMIDEFSNKLLCTDRILNSEIIPTVAAESGNVDPSNIKIETDQGILLTRSKKDQLKNSKDTSFYYKIRNEFRNSLGYVNEDIISYAVELDISNDTSLNYY